MESEPRPPVEQDGEPEPLADHDVPGGYLEAFEAKDAERARKAARS